jgi:hypothetical protein
MPSAPLQGLFREAPSAASLALEYFKTRLKRDCTELVHWVDRIDSADFTQSMVLQPEKPDYVLLSMTVSGEDGDGQPYRIIAMLVENESCMEDFGYAVDGVRFEMGGAGTSDPADPAGSRTGRCEWSRATSM